jgi:hypothetical protein
MPIGTCSGSANVIEFLVNYQLQRKALTSEKCSETTSPRLSRDLPIWLTSEINALDSAAKPSAMRFAHRAKPGEISVGPLWSPGLTVSIAVGATRADTSPTVFGRLTSRGSPLIQAERGLGPPAGRGWNPRPLTELSRTAPSCDRACCGRCGARGPPRQGCRGSGAPPGR